MCKKEYGSFALLSNISGAPLDESLEDIHKRLQIQPPDYSKYIKDADFPLRQGTAYLSPDTLDTANSQLEPVTMDPVTLARNALDIARQYDMDPVGRIVFPETGPTHEAAAWLVEHTADYRW